MKRTVAPSPAAVAPAKAAQPKPSVERKPRRDTSPRRGDVLRAGPWTEGAGSGVDAVDDIRFAPSGVGTRVDYIADIRLRGWMRLLEPFAGGAFRRIAADAVAGMRRALDDRAAAR